MQGSATTAMQEHRRGAMTPQMASRRRNPRGGRQFAGARPVRQDLAVSIGRQMQSAGHDARIHFSAAC
jgi:hypothetical protein